MFQIEAGRGKTIRAADTNRIIANINPTRRISFIQTGHYDSVQQSYADVVSDINLVLTKSDEVETAAAQVAQNAADASASASSVSGSLALAQAAATTATADADRAENAETSTVAAQNAANLSQLAAAQSAANAFNSETIVSNAAAAIRLSHAGFESNYLGAFATPPTTGVAGGALAQGNLYLDTGTDPHSMKIYEGTIWVDLTASAHLSRTLYFFLASDGQHVFSGEDAQGNTLTFTQGNVNVYVNGALLAPTDYNTTSNTTVTIAQNFPMVLADEVLIEAFTNFSLSDHVSGNNGGSFLGNVDFIGNAAFQGETSFQGNIAAQGNVVFQGNSDVVVQGGCTVEDHLAVEGTLDVEGLTSVTTLSATGSLGVGNLNNLTFVADNATQSVILGGATTANAGMSITGGLTSDALTVNGSMTAQGGFAPGNLYYDQYGVTVGLNTGATMPNGARFSHAGSEFKTASSPALKITRDEDATVSNKEILQFLSQVNGAIARLGGIEATNGGLVFRPDDNDYGWEYGVNGVRFDGVDQYLVPAGTILDFAGSTAPAGFFLCHGQAVSRSIYSKLFAVLGTTYGDGGPGADQTTHFRVPDLRGRITAGSSNGTVSRLGIDETVIGTTGGSDEATLGVNNLPAHSHTGSTSTAPEHTHGAGSYQTVDTQFDTQGTGHSQYREVWGEAQRDTYTLDVSGTSAPSGAHSHTFTTENTGGGEAFDITQPTMILNKIIKY